jgi:phosphomannomutase
MGCFIGRLCAGNFQLSIVKNNKNQGGCKKMSYQETYKKWCTDPYFDAQTQEELKNLEGNEKEIEDRFYRQLEFGTGGLRGMIGAGTNRMNIYTVRQATQGLANYIIAMNGQDKGVAIAHDSRIMSPEFAREAALCLNANGIHTYLFESLRPTPELSFAVRELGFTQVYVVEEQKVPDGNFPTVPYPNPEDKNAWTLALELAKKVDADIILATDPDADRLGVHAKDTKTGEYVSFTGNMSGMLIAEYILRERTKTGTMPENPALVETIVTTDMAKAVAKEYNTALIEVLTGFKYIGEQIRLFDETGSHHYVFGLEESYGCLAGTYARDKDAPVAVMMLCEVAAYYKLQGKTLWDAMVELYEKYGYYKEDLATVTLKGIDGSQKITAMMNAFRENPPKKLGGFKVLACRDYKSDCRRDMITGETTSTGLPTSNVLYYELENNAWCCVRPSGTEPKIKYYFGVKGENFKDAEEKLEALKKAMTE